MELKKRKRSASFGKEVDLDGLWADVRSLDTSFLPFRNETIDKWNQKVQVASGTASLQKKFKVINQVSRFFDILFSNRAAHRPLSSQSVLSQIQHILNDKDRLIKRSQLKRSEYKIFGSNGSELSGPNEESKGDAHLSEYHSEIYDDDDFYQELLKELIESRMADTGEIVCFVFRKNADVFCAAR